MSEAGIESNLAESLADKHSLQVYNNIQFSESEGSVHLSEQRHEISEYSFKSTETEDNYVSSSSSGETYYQSKEPKAKCRSTGVHKSRKDHRHHLCWARTSRKDWPEIQNLIDTNTFEYFEEENISTLIDKAVISFSIYSSKTNDLVGYASFSDFPFNSNIPVNMDWEHWINQLYGFKKMTSMNTTFFKIAVWKPDFYPDIINFIFEVVFFTYRRLTYVCFVKHPRLKYFEGLKYMRARQPLVAQEEPSSSRSQILYWASREEIINYVTLEHIEDTEQMHFVDFINRSCRSKLNKLAVDSVENLRSKKLAGLSGETLTGPSGSSFKSSLAVQSALTILFAEADPKYLKARTWENPPDDLYRLKIRDRPNDFVIAVVDQTVNLNALGNDFKIELCDYFAASVFPGGIFQIPEEKLFLFNIKFKESFDESQMNPLLQMKLSEDEYMDALIADEKTKSTALNAPKPSKTDSNEQYYSMQQSPRTHWDPHVTMSDLQNHVLQFTPPEFQQSGGKFEQNFCQVLRQRFCIAPIEFSPPADYTCPFTGEPDAFVVVMLAMTMYANDVNCVQFLKELLNTRPNCGYCLFFFPLTEHSCPILNFLYRVPAREYNKNTRNLYVTHRLVYKGRVQVRIAEKSDLKSISLYLKSHGESENIFRDVYELILAKNTTKFCFILTSDNHLAGIATVEKEQIDMETLKALYNIECHLHWRSNLSKDPGLIKHFFVTRVFEPHVRYFCNEIMRMIHSTELFHFFNLDTSLHKPTQNGEMYYTNNALTFWVPIRPRQIPTYYDSYLGSNVPDEKILKFDSHFALYYLSARIASIRKVSNNVRVVVVGAGNTGLGFLEELFFSIENESYSFTNVTLVSDGGLPKPVKPGSKSFRSRVFNGKYTDEYFKALMLHAKVNVIDGVVVELDREKRYIVLSNGSFIFYDYLFLFVGAQYLYPQPTSIESPFLQNCQFSLPSNASAYQLTPQPINLFLMNSYYKAEEAVRILKSFKHDICFNVPSDEPAKNPSYIIVYGNTLDAFLMINTLLESQFNPSLIMLITPPMATKDPSDYLHPRLFPAIFKIIQEARVEVRHRMSFVRWELRPDGSIYSVDFKTITTESITIRCDGFFSFTTPGISAQNLYIFNQANLVVTKRLAIDRNCHVIKDERIYAGGRFTRYLLHLRGELAEHRCFVPHEIGAHIATKFRKLMQFQDEIEKPVNTDKIFRTKMIMKPTMRYCELPGGLHFLHIIKPGPIFLLEESFYRGGIMGMELATGSLLDPKFSGYFRILLDIDGVVKDIMCLTTEKINANDIMKIYGQHERSLNRLVWHWEANMIFDLFDFFRQPWAYVFYHDRYDEFLKRRKEIIYEPMGEGDDAKSWLEVVSSYLLKLKWKSPTQKQFNKLRKYFIHSPTSVKLQIALLRFIDENANLLPMYVTPKIQKFFNWKCLNSALTEKTKSFFTPCQDTVHLPVRTRIQCVYDSINHTLENEAEWESFLEFLLKTEIN